MKTDRIFEVKEQAFRVLQNFGEDVRLTKKKKGKPVKTINDKLLIFYQMEKSERNKARRMG